LGDVAEHRVGPAEGDHGRTREEETGVEEHVGRLGPRPEEQERYGPRGAADREYNGGAPPRSSTAMLDRARREAGGDLVVEPVLDLVGRQSAESVGAEPRHDVPRQVSTVGLLRQWREPAGELEDLLCPLRKRHIGAAGVDPTTALDLDLLLAQEASGVRLAREGATTLPAERVAIARPVLAVPPLDEPHCEPPVWLPGSVRGAKGAETRGFEGSWRSFPVSHGQPKNDP
jgi:hypothetical protein